jgi:hypothetical protein
MALYNQFKVNYGDYDDNKQRNRFIAKLLVFLVYGLLALLALVGAIYPAMQASNQSLIVPYLIDYIDYDNYRRVIEWMVTPTYNHLTSYMFGIALAFVVVRERANRELRKMQTSHWAFDGTVGQYNQREGSVESIRSSSTQELHQQDGLTFRQPLGISVGSPAIRHIGGQQIHTKQFNISSCSSASSDKRFEDGASVDDLTDSNSCAGFIKSTSCLLACLLSLLASWFWNGLGQPMSDEQTFWFVMITKLVFCATFAHLFYTHFATRRNSSNPWMVTRFLVPIGRMSLTVFYVSWLVIWFDLLASLYQWHPSHYFICEKYNEIIFITLILSMFIYGAFEGIVKRIQYSTRTSKLRHDIETSTNLIGDCGSSPTGCIERTRYRMKPFESFFDASDKPTLLELYDELKLNESSDVSQSASDRNQSTSSADNGNNKLQSDNGNKLNSLATIDSINQQQQLPINVHRGNLNNSGKPVYLTSTGDVSSVGASGNLSPSDRYKLNAELRANYSFASIGLYESAGATGDLSPHGTSDPNDKRR